MICGECRFNTYDHEKKDFYCGNEDSENYGLFSAYDDGCSEGEEKQQ